jgi:flagellar hook-associated protein 2
VTANVVTSNGQSTLSLASQTAGSSGALTVSSSIVATSDTPLSYSGSSATSTANASGTLAKAAGQGDLLSGSISIQVGSGATYTLSVPDSPNNTLSGLAEMINEAPMGVTASVVQNADGSYGLSLYSQTSGSAGDLTVTSKLLDTTNTGSTALSYTNSSDVNSLTTLGISVSNDGTLSFDAGSLDSVLNADFSGVVGFFQGANSWGQSFHSTLTNAGTSSTKGILKLASSSNSSIESMLNANISREESLISAESKSLTTELNSANEILQAIPSELNQINELYSAITGYSKTSS